MAETLGTTNLPVEAESQDRMVLVFGVKDLYATVKKLQERGARFVTEPRVIPNGVFGQHTSGILMGTSSKLTVLCRLPNGQRNLEKRRAGLEKRKSGMGIEPT